MKIRKLEPKDVDGLLEWMRDPDIYPYFHADFLNMEKEDVLKFIENSKNTTKDYHVAVVNDNDEYLGTVSLKNIDRVVGKAEYAISFCKKAHGTGASMFGTQQILKIAFDELNLNRVYLNVLSENIRANKFYQKCGFIYEGEFKEDIEIHGVIRDLKWYRMLKKEYAISKIRKYSSH